jgi:hypothetical protein
MDLWAATAMMSNWLEGRDAGGERQTWLVTTFGNPSGLLTAAETIGVTVEEIDVGDDGESYQMLVGRPGSGWAGACWENRRSRSTVGGASKTWPMSGPDCCNAEAPCPDAACSRDVGHAGRHMASLGAGFGHRVIAAWPGVHAPKKADLS